MTEFIEKQKTPAIESFLRKEQVCNFTKNSTRLQVFFDGFYESFQDKYFEEHL